MEGAVAPALAVAAHDVLAHFDRPLAALAALLVGALGALPLAVGGAAQARATDVVDEGARVAADQVPLLPARRALVVVVVALPRSLLVRFLLLFLVVS